MQDSQQPNPILVQLFTEASAHQSQGNLSMALVAYKRIQRQFPDFVDAWTNGSAVLLEMGRLEEAQDMAVKAVESGPENSHALYALANAQQKLGLVEDALASFQKITDLAGFFNKKGQFEEALDVYDRLIQNYPSVSDLYVNRGYIKSNMMDLAGAEEDCNKALELDKNDVLSRRNLGLLQLLQYRYHEAWDNVLARANEDTEGWGVTGWHIGKMWRGEPLDGRTLLVIWHLGLGDNLQFSRLIPRLKRFDGRVLFWIPRPLWRLFAYFEDSYDIDGIALEGEPMPIFDLSVPIIELPAILDIGLSDLAPLPPPTLPEPQAIPELDRPGFKVGLTWAGNKGHDNDHYRSMNPHYLDVLADIEGIAWYGLQLPKATELPNLPGFIDLSHHINDFLDTAQIIRQLDLVVTVDTSMAHLAGTLGLPAVVLLAFKPDWRWGATGRQTPWYPSLTLLRQPAHGDWQSVVEELRKMIHKLTTDN